MKIEIGKKYRIFWSKGNLNNATIHIRAIVDGDQVVYKEWWSGKQYWHYAIKDMMWFDMLNKKGVIQQVR